MDESIKDKFSVESFESPTPDWVDMFFSTDFLSLHREAFPNTHHIGLFRKSDHALFGATAFSEIEPGHYRSPARGSYGSFSLNETGNYPVSQLEYFVEETENILKDKGAKRMDVVDAPFSYDPHSRSILFNIFMRRNYQILRHELNLELPITTQEFESRIDYGNRKRLKKCEREGVTVEVLTPDRYEEAYQVIRANREKRQVPMTMEWKDLKLTTEKMKDKFRVVSAFQNGEMVAASFTIHVRPKVMYVFYWAEKPGFESLSPVTPLAKHHYEYCQKNQIEILDIGVSTASGVPNEGLIRYKENLGCKASLKLTWSRTF